MKGKATRNKFGLLTCVGMDSFETEFLLPRSSRRSKLKERCKPFLVALVIVTFLISLAALGLVYRCELGGKCNKTVKSSMPSLFKASFMVEDNTGNGMNTERIIEITWNRQTKDLRYRETVFHYPEESSHKTTRSTERIQLMTLTVARNLSHVTINGVQHDDIACDVQQSSEWYPVFYSVLSSKQKMKKSASCPGKVWSKGDIQACVQKSKILYIRNGQQKVTLTSWSPIVKAYDIPLPKSGKNCWDVTKLIGETNEEKPRIKHLKSKRPTNSNKICLFIHGAGNKEPGDGFKTLDTFVDYWGHIEKYTPSCREHKFIRFDTVSKGWDNPSLQEDFCKFATSGNSNKEIVHKTIFSHSLGNLIVGAALHRGVCSIDHKTTKWFSAQGPWRATKVADTLKKVCACLLGTKCHLDSKFFMPIFKHQKYCDGPVMSQAYKGLIQNYKSSTGVTFEDLVKTASSNVSGCMCGNSAWGMGKDKLDSALLVAVQGLSHLQHPNDGLVPFESCKLAGDFKTTYTSRFYNAHINHREGTCRDGDRKANNMRPCGWYEKMAELAST